MQYDTYDGVFEFAALSPHCPRLEASSPSNTAQYNEGSGQLDAWLPSQWVKDAMKWNDDKNTSEEWGQFTVRLYT